MPGGDSTELDALRYKTGCISKSRVGQDQDASAIDKILESESTATSGKPWARLNQTERVHRLKRFSYEYCEKNEGDQKELIKTLMSGLERKRLTGAKDVVYNQSTETVTSIPCLSYHTAAKRFTLRRSDKRISTTKSLGKRRVVRRRKTKPVKSDTGIDQGES